MSPVTEPGTMPFSGHVGSLRQLPQGAYADLKVPARKAVQGPIDMSEKWDRKVALLHWTCAFKTPRNQGVSRRFSPPI